MSVLTAAQQDQIEAAELQSWLVGNARTVRPVERSGLMAWALAALKASQAENAEVLRRYNSLVSSRADE